MNKWIVLLGIFIVWTAIWTTIVRPWMRDKPQFKPFFDAIEPIERALWNKSESILWARTLQVVGALLSLLTYIGSLNLAPLIALLPPEWQPLGYKLLPVLPLIVSILGAIDERHRRDTAEPLAVVQVPANTTPEVKAAVQNFEIARAEVKAVIAEAKGG